MMKKIMIVDDHPLLREGLERVIGVEDGLAVCGVAGSVQEALRQLAIHAPDLVLTDLILPGRNGLELIKDLRATHPELPVLVLSGRPLVEEARSWQEAGRCCCCRCLGDSGSGGGRRGLPPCP